MVAIRDTTLADLGWPALVDHWAARCATARGAAAVRREPLLDQAAAARARVAEIAEARALAEADAAVPLGGISDVAAAIERVRKSAALEAPDLIAVARTGAALTRLHLHLRTHAEAAPRLAEHGVALTDLGHVYHPILEAFDSDGRLVDHASDALGPLRRAVAALTAQLDRRMEELVNDPRFAPLLQDSYYTQRDDRYVLPVRTDGKGFVKGIVHGTSQTGQTIFIEPDEIVDLNNKKKLAECEVADEERRILVRLSGWVAEEADAFEVGLAAAEVLDVVVAAAVMADDLVAAAPAIDDAPRIGLLHARHPLMLLAGRRCVANDVTVAAGGSLLISGPNAGGKTVALKTIGLAALMTRAGLHLPAEPGSSMGWFTDVRADIGDAQSLEANLSTFTGHVVALRDYLAEGGPGTLILIDEIAVGTDPEQGAALAQAVLEGLAARGVTAVCTTHYERLKAVATSDPRFANASVGFDLERLEPTFKLHAGVPGSSGALVVARRMGLPEPVVTRAQELLGEAGVQIELLLTSVAEQRRRLEEERVAQLAEVEALEAERMALRADRDRVRARAERDAARMHGEAVAALRAARAQIEAVRAALRRKAEPSEDDVREARRAIDQAGREVARHQPRTALPPGRRAGPGELLVGTPVLVPALGARGEVAAPAERGRIEVRLGGMHVAVDVADVLIDKHRYARRGEASPAAGGASGGAGTAGAGAGTGGASGGGGGASGGVVGVDGRDERAPARTPGTTLDLRGKRVDEIDADLDRCLDEAMLHGHDAVFVIHGHGTGALRSAVRARLGGHVAVKQFRPGEPSEGGDGVTVILLRD